MDLQESRAAAADIFAHFFIRRNRGNDGNDVVPVEQARYISYAANVFVPVPPAEAQVGTDLLPDFIAIKDFVAD